MEHLIKLETELFRECLKQHYEASFPKVIQELETMTDEEARLHIGGLIDILEENIKQMIYLKGKLRHYQENRKSDAEILRAIYRKYMVM